MVEGVAIDVTPAIATDKGRDEEQEGGLRLVEISDHAAYDVVAVAGGDDDLGGGVEGTEVVAVQPVEDGAERGEDIDVRRACGGFIGLPLLHFQVGLGGRGVGEDFPSYIVQGFEGADAGGAYGGALSAMAH